MFLYIMSNIKEKVEERKFLYKRVPKVENFRQIQVSSIDHTYGVDLIDYTGNNQGNNRGYILVVVDYHSRFCQTRVMNTKTKTEIEKNLKTVFQYMDIPQNIHCDRESAIIHSAYLKKLGVNVYHTDTTHAHTTGGSPIAERLIQTLKGRLEQYRDATEFRQWKRHVDIITDDYNHKKHSTIGMSPHDAYFTRNKELDTKQAERALEHSKEVKQPKKEVEKGQEVIEAKEKQTFTKGYAQKWNTEILTIEEVLPTTPITFKLSNGKTAYLEEIQILEKNQVKLLSKKKEAKPKEVKEAPKKEERTGPITRSMAKKYPNMVRHGSK